MQSRQPATAMGLRAQVTPLARLFGAALLVAAAGCSQPAAPAWSGYAEGDFVFVASAAGGTLQTLSVQAGQAVAAGAPLFTLEADAEQAAVAEMRARASAALSQAQNTDSGRRADEVAVTQAQLGQARAQATLARSELSRVQQLIDQGFVSAARLDDARAAAAQSQARVAELEAALRVAQLPARGDERAAAHAAADAAAQAVRQTDWRLAQKAQRAPAAGTVAETFYRVGEWVSPGQPVVSILPTGAVKLRFFVAQAEIASLAPGQSVAVSCDGCGTPIAARIARIATQAEYTPPVIYSNAQRARLVFMVEARPEGAEATRLKPGQPIDVRRAP